MLIIVSAASVFSDTPDCRQSFELGWEEAEEMHRSRGWYWIGVAAGLSALVVYNAVDSYLWDQSEVDPVTGPETVTSPWPFVCLVTVAAAPLVPSFLFPRQTKILPPDDESNPDCYREGYAKRAHRKNTRALLYGELTVGGVVLAACFLFATAMSVGWD